MSRFDKEGSVENIKICVRGSPRFSLFLDDSQSFPQLCHSLHDALLHEVEAHGYHGHAQEDVHRAKDELYVDQRDGSRGVDLVPQRVPGNDIAETDGAEGDEAEVAPVEETPALPFAKENRPATDIGDHDTETQ